MTGFASGKFAAGTAVFIAVLVALVFCINPGHARWDDDWDTSHDSEIYSDFSDTGHHGGHGSQRPSDGIVYADPERIVRADRSKLEIQESGLSRDDRDEFNRWWYNAKFLIENELFEQALVSLNRCAQIWEDSPEVELLIQETRARRLARYRYELTAEQQVIKTVGVDEEPDRYETYGFPVIELRSEARRQYILGLRAAERSNINMAERRFLRAIELNSKFPEPYIEMGLIRLMSANPDTAGDFLERALRLRQHGALENFLFGWFLLFHEEERQRADDHFARAVQVEPYSEIAAIARGYRHEINRLELIDDLMFTQGINELHLLSFTERELTTLRRWESALEEECRIAAEVNPEWWFSEYALGKAYECLRKWPDAARIWQSISKPEYVVRKLSPLIESYRRREAESFDPSSPEGRVARAVLLIAEERYENAMHELTEALRMDSQLADAHVWLGVLLRRTGEVYQAIDSLLTAISLAPDNWRAYLELGEEYIMQANYAEAEVKLVKATQLAPDEVRAWYTLGTLQLDNAMYDDAYDSLQRTLDLKHDHVGARLDMGRLYTEQGEFERATAENEMVMRLDPSSWQAYTNMGIIYYYQWEMGQGSVLLDSAIEMMNRALMVVPDNDRHVVREYLDIFTAQRGF